MCLFYAAGSLTARRIVRWFSLSYGNYEGWHSQIRSTSRGRPGLVRCYREPIHVHFGHIRDEGPGATLMSHSKCDAVLAPTCD